MSADGAGAASSAGRRTDPGLMPALALVLLAALPVLLARYPAMLDYPAHLARWHVMLEGAASPDLQRFYRFDWQWVPNLGADILIRPFAALFGLEPGGRAVLGLVAILLGGGFVATELALRGRVGVGSLLALCTVWSPTLLMGFVNFALAEGLAFLSFALWVRLGGWRWRAAAFLTIGPVVWLCHLAGWGILGVLVFGHEWARRGARGWLAAALSTWPLWPPLGLTLLAGGSAAAPFAFTLAELAGKSFYWVIALRDQSAPLDIATALLLAVLPLVALRRGWIDARIGVAALLFAVLVFLVPRNLGGGDFADYRLVPVALATGALAIDSPLRARWLALAALPFMVRLGVTSTAWQRQSAETEMALGALDHLPQGAVVAGAWGFRPASWRQSPQGHIFAYVTVRRDALTNAHFAIPGLHALQLAVPDPGFVDPSQRIVLAPGERADLATFGPAGKAQWLWYFGEEPPLHLPAGARVVWQRGPSLLARLAKGAQDR